MKHEKQNFQKNDRKNDKKKGNKLINQQISTNQHFLLLQNKNIISHRNINISIISIQNLK